MRKGEGTSNGSFDAFARKNASFSALLEAIGRGRVEARKQLIKLARARPSSVIPYAREVATLLDSTRLPVRQASIELLSLLSKVSPSAMAFLLPKLHELLSSEPQNAIANHAIEILHNYARTGREASRKVIPILTSSINKLKPRAAQRISTVLEDLSRLK